MPSWYSGLVKRILVLLVLISIVPLVWCGADDLTIDPSKIFTDTNAPPVNLAAEVARAKRENKLLLLEFGRSDECPPCIFFQQKIYSSPEFQAFAKTNLDMVRLDFPLKVALRPDTTMTNVLLSDQFNIYVFPTFIALDKNGKEFWRTPLIHGDTMTAIDWTQVAPTNFIDLLKHLKKYAE
jgi:thioredoxin-related protein